MDLVWGEGSGRVARTLTLLSRVSVVLEKSEKPFDFTAVIESPLVAGAEEVTLD